MKKRKGLLFLIIFLFVLCGWSCVYGHAGDKVKRIEMKIEIKENGNASITEKWYANLFDGYSYYKFYKNVDESEIVNFSVRDEKGTVYEYIENWDSSMPNEEKIDKCGVVYTNGDAALIWGINGYGAHEYTLNYEVCNFVRKINNYKGSKFYFIDQRNFNTYIYNNVFKCI